ncbi:MAG: hypothetical protein JXB25_03035 [Deltaproteobacteria bacterium]|nr:hypothetical protein [Deltaproteobacteria bacterium]
MKPWVPVGVGLLLLWCFTGCASKMMAEVADAEAAYAPAAGQALVVFLRPTHFGGAIQSSLHDITGDGYRFVGIVAAKTKIAYPCEPGERLFMVVGESADFMKAELLPDKVYYVVINPRMGAWKARFSLIAARKHEDNPEKFIKRVQECQWVENTEASHQWAHRNAPSIHKKKNAYLPKWQARTNHEMDVLLPEDGFDRVF